MSPQERQSTLALAGIYAFRMLGLFMILPIFSLYIHSLKQATPTLIGLALGSYGLTQALLQIPFAMTSDRLGRKPVILVGLILFILGSVIAALTNNIYGIIIGRAIQGAGAIGSTLMALAADNTQEENRLKAMAMIGMTIGISFIIAMILGSVVNHLIGLSGIFWLTAVLACGGIVLLLTVVPTPPQHNFQPESEAAISQFGRVLSNVELLRLNAGIFSLHAILMAFFIVLPLMLTHIAGLPVNQQWKIYLLTLVIAALCMSPFVMIAEKKRWLKQLLIGAVALLTFTQILFLLVKPTILSVSFLLCLFFTAFTFLESCLPSLVSKFAPVANKGTAMGIYSSSQFLGIFCGGTVGGLLYHHLAGPGIFIFTILLGMLWLILAITMKQPSYRSIKSKN